MRRAREPGHGPADEESDEQAPEHQEIGGQDRVRGEGEEIDLDGRAVGDGENHNGQGHRQRHEPGEMLHRTLA